MPTDFSQAPPSGLTDFSAPPPEDDHPIARRFGEAVQETVKDYTPPKNLEEAGKAVVGALSPVHQLKVAGDLANIPLSVVGGAMEHATGALQRAGATKAINLPPWLRSALTTVSPTAAGALGLWNVGAADPKGERRAAGDVAQALTPVPGVEAAEGAVDLAKAAKLAQESHVGLPTAIAMLRQVVTKEVPIKEPGIGSRVSHLIKEAERKIKKDHNDEDIVSPQTQAMGEQQGRALIRRLVAKRDPLGVKLTTNPIEAAGKPITAAEALGREATSHLTMFGRRGGKTPDTLYGNLADRMSEMPTRVVDDFAAATGLHPAEVEGDFHAANEATRQANDPLYKTAYAQGSLDSDKLRQLSVRPDMKDAFRRAYRMAENEGVNPEEIGLIVGPKTAVRRGEKGLERVPVQENIEVRHPTVRTWDFVKRALADGITKDTRTGRLTGEGRITNNTLRDLREELFSLSPAYKAAVDHAGEPLRQEEAFRSATKLFTGNTSEFQFRDALRKLSPSDRRALLSGALKDIWTKASGSSLGLKRLLTPSYQAKFRELIGKDKADALFKRVEMERDLQANANRMIPGGNSVTGELEFADQEHRDLVQDFAPAARQLARRGIAHGWLPALLEMAKAPITGAYRGFRAPLEEASRDEAGSLLQMSPSDLHNYLERLKLDPPTTQKIERLVKFVKARKVAGGISAAVGASLVQQSTNSAP